MKVRSTYSRDRKYHESWEKDPRFKHWIQGQTVGGKKVAYCKICRKTLGPRLDTLVVHSKCHEPVKLTDLQKSVIKLELALSALVVARNVAYLFCNHFVPLLKRFLPDSEIMKRVSLDRLKATWLVKDVLASAQRARLINILNSQRFSIIIDESTDISTCHSFCIIVRYFDYQRNCIVDSMWDLTEIYDSKNAVADADSIFLKLMNALESEKFPVSNIFSFCSDTCNLMHGRFDSIATRLRQKIPGIHIIKCNAHIEHLASWHAMKVFPDNIEKFVSKVHNYINGSARRRSRWKFLQEENGKKNLNVLNPHLVRWLSFQLAVRRLVIRWTVLKNFFEEESVGDKDAQEILKEINGSMRIYLAFLNFVLAKFRKANKMMQSVMPIISKSLDPMSNLLKKLLLCYKNRKYVMKTKLSDIDPKSYVQSKPVNKIKIGRRAHYYLTRNKSLNIVQKFGILQKLGNFLKTAAAQLKSRLNINYEWLKARNFCHPKNALSARFHSRKLDLDSIFSIFPLSNLDKHMRDSINDEWKKLVTHKFSNEIITEKQVDVFWAKVMNCVGSDGRPLFKNLAEYALTLLLILQRFM